MFSKKVRANSCPSFSWSTKLNVCSVTKAKEYKQVNQYLILSKLGEGSYSKVYLAQDQNTKKYYALKRVQLKSLSKSQAGLEQLHFEIEVMKKVKHQNVISLQEVIHVPSENVIYIVIEYANCGNLSSYLENENLKFEQIQSIFSQIVDAVSFIHQNSIVHQDLKPSNILMKSDGKILVTDFGISRKFDCEAKMVGTPAYQAPEIIQDSKNIFSPEQEDVWSLGVTLYELVFKCLPFDGQNVFDIVNSISKKDTLEPPMKCDEMLWDLIKKMLTVDPKKRITIPEIMKHPYYINDKKINFNLHEIIAPKVDADSKIMHIEGTVFEDENEIFQSQIKNQFESGNSLIGR